MKNINLKSPRYIIPLIMLPFLFMINWLLQDMFPAQAQTESSKQELTTFNADLPDAHLDKRQIKQKFESFKETYKNSRDFTAINEIDEKSDADLIELEHKENSKYTLEEQQLIDSINHEILKGDRTSFLDEIEKRAKRKEKEMEAFTKASQTTEDKISNPSFKRNSGRKRQSKKEEEETYEEREMRLFRQQMMMIDSISKSPEQRAEEEAERKRNQALERELERKAQQKEKQLKVSKTPHQQEFHFNTIKRKQEEDFIRAMIDEDIKVVDGSRVKIRIMEDLYAGGYQIRKGSYLYGIVSSFGKQRLSIRISSILVDQQILPVDLRVYDHDGLEGLYIPSSEFTDFTKGLGGDLASGASYTIESTESPGSLNEVFYGLANQGIRSGTKAAGKAAKKNKARLKYNTIIYLIDPDQLK